VAAALGERDGEIMMTWRKLMAPVALAGLLFAAAACGDDDDDAGGEVTRRRRRPRMNRRRRRRVGRLPRRLEVVRLRLRGRGSRSP
jgi:hypothetical protein